jgi:hypothetical protein
MSRHSFDPVIAEMTSLAAAVIFQNISFWCEKNEANGRHLHDGKTWSYNSITAFEKLFPYLTKSQIRTALEKLEEVGLLEVGAYNKDPRDRTKWYAMGRTSICEKSQIQLSEIANSFATDRKPLPDIKPDINNTPNPQQGADDLFSEDPEEPKPDPEAERIEAGFKEFWDEIWPSHTRKTGKADCLKVYTQACSGKHPKAQKVDPAALNDAARAYIRSVSDPQYLKGTLPWLRLPGWEPFLAETGGQVFSIGDLSNSQRRSLEAGRVPPSMMVDGQPNAAAHFWLKKFGWKK